MSEYTGFRRLLGAFLGKSHQGDRDLYASFGYSTNLSVKEFFALYYRNDIAQRIVRAFPSATWRQPPQVKDESEEDALSEFCEAWIDFADKHKIYSYLERADRLSGIGSFALLHMGFDDGQREDQPLEAGNHPLLYLKPYSESNVSVTRWDMNPASSRYGLPEVFTVQQGNSSTSRDRTPSVSINVHYSRCVHIAEFLEDDDFFGTPRLECVYNRLKDLEKVIGASAETYFQNSKKPISFETDPDANVADTPEDKQALQRQMDEFYHQLRPYLALQGIKANVLDTRVEDPSGIVNGILDLIAGAVGIPKRILIGSERGELSSAQDENNWSSRIDERKQNFASPFVMRPFIEKLIITQNLPEPQGQFYIDWEGGSSLGDVEKAQIALQKTQALQTYANTPAADMYVSPQEVRVWLDLDPDEMPEIEELPEIPFDLDEPFTNEETFKPTDAMKRAAQKVLEWRDEHGDEVNGMTRVGWTRANQIAKGETLSADTIKRMASFFARHEGNEEIAEEHKGKPWKDAGYVSFLGWGGASGRSFAERMSKRLDDE